MALIQFTNQISSQALRGQNVKITVDLSTQLAEFTQLQVGQYCENDDSLFIGYVYSIDTFGNTFEISPAAPNLNMSGGPNAPGYFLAGIVCNVTV